MSTSSKQPSSTSKAPKESETSEQPGTPSNQSLNEIEEENASGEELITTEDESAEETRPCIPASEPPKPSKLPYDKQLDLGTGLIIDEKLKEIEETKTYVPVSKRPTTKAASDRNIQLGTRLIIDEKTKGEGLAYVPVSKRPATKPAVDLGTRLVLDGSPSASKLPTIISKAPSNVKSILSSRIDIKMATKQLTRATMTPKESKVQDEWVQSMIKLMGACPEGFDWNRKEGGYQCKGGGHGVTDELLAEGKGGIVALRTLDWNVKDGPYYKDPESEKFFKPRN